MENYGRTNSAQELGSQQFQTGALELDFTKLKNVASKYLIDPGTAYQLFCELHTLSKPLKPENSAHSFAEGSDDAITRNNENSDFINRILSDKVDVEKVIEDLVADLKYWVDKGLKDIYTFNDSVDKLKTETNSHLQNAEAALGMLQAFKQKHEKPTIELFNKVRNLAREERQKRDALHEQVFGDNAYFPKSELELGIRNKLREALPDLNPNKDDRMDTANAIIAAIDQMIKLRGL